MKSLSIPALALTLALGCQTAPIQSESAAAPAGAALPTNVEQILQAYQRQSGANLTYDATTATLLQSLVVRPIGAAGEVLLIERSAPVAELATPAFEVIALQFASARELAPQISTLMATAGSGTTEGETRVLADARTNSLLVLAGPDPMAHVKRMVDLLDVRLPAGG